MNESQEKEELVVSSKSCEWCDMVLVEPVYRCNSGHEICGPCYSDAMYNREVETERRDQGGGETSEEGQIHDNFDGENFQRNKLAGVDVFRPHTVSGTQWRINQVPSGSVAAIYERDDSNEELSTDHRPPEYKKSFIDIIAGISGSHITSRTDVDTPSEYSEVETNVLEEVFKKKSISSLDSNRSGGRSMFKPFVCPLESCHKYVSVSGLTNHFKFDHRNIPIEKIPCNQSVSFFITSSTVSEDNVNHKILVVESETEDPLYFTLNIKKHAVPESTMLLIWIAEIHMNVLQYHYKIQANNNASDEGKVFSYFGPVVTNHQDARSVFHNGDCLVIPMTVFDSFKDFADGFDLNLTFVN